MSNNYLDYTANLIDDIDYNKLLARVHHVINLIAGVNIYNCRSRAIKLDNFCVGEGTDDNKAFVNLRIRILHGRTNDVNQVLADKLLEVLEEAYTESIHNMDVQISVSIVEVDSNDYAKYPSGMFTRTFDPNFED